MNSKERISELLNENYNVIIPVWGMIIEVDQFVLACRAQDYTDYDGYGRPAHNGKMNDHYKIWPSNTWNIPIDATHIIWFSK